MLHTQLVALGLALTTLVVSGCGGSSKSTVVSNATTQTNTGTAEASTDTNTNSAQTSTNSADTSLIAQANTICRHMKTVVASNNPHGNPGQSQTPQQTAARISRSASYEGQEATELASLTRSSSSSSSWQPLISAIHTFSGDLNSYAVAIRTSAPQATDNQLVEKVSNGERQMTVAATRIGATYCAKPE